MKKNLLIIALSVSNLIVIILNFHLKEINTRLFADSSMWERASNTWEKASNNFEKSSNEAIKAAAEAQAIAQAALEACDARVRGETK